MPITRDRLGRFARGSGTRSLMDKATGTKSTALKKSTIIKIAQQRSGSASLTTQKLRDKQAKFLKKYRSNK